MGLVGLVALLRLLDPSIVGREESVGPRRCGRYLGHAEAMGQRQRLLIDGLSADDEDLLLGGAVAQGLLQ